MRWGNCRTYPPAARGPRPGAQPPSKGREVYNPSSYRFFTVKGGGGCAQWGARLRHPLYSLSLLAPDSLLILHYYSPPYGDSLLAMVVSLDLILSPSTPVQRPLPAPLQMPVTMYSYAYHRARPSRA